MAGETTKQELAEAILKVIIPMVETGDGIDDGPIQEFCLDHAEVVLTDLRHALTVGLFKPKQP